jgi:hypothetical protein
MAYREYAVKKFGVFECQKWFKEGRDVQDDLRVAATNAKNRCKCGLSTNLGTLSRRLGVRLVAEGYGNLFGGNNLNSGLT